MESVSGREADTRGEDSTADDIRSVLRDVLDRGDGSWQACADAGLLALAAPPEYGGGGLGFEEVGVLLSEAGRRAIRLPLWETLACGLLPLLASGTREMQERLVPPVIAGELAFAPALREVGNAFPASPRTRFDGARIDGSKIAVPVLDIPAMLLVSATGPDGAVVAIVDPGAEGISTTPSATSRGAAEATYEFERTPVLGVLDADVVRQHAIAGLLLLGAGVLAGALEITARHIEQREQFGRRLAEFQGVAMQIADVFIASRLTGLAAAEVARRVCAGEPVAADLAIAAYWFCEQAPAALQTCHHLHGGTGVDVSYPLAAYFSQVRDLAGRLGARAALLAGVPVAGDDGTNAELTEQQRAFKSDVREYFATLSSDEDRLETMSNRFGPAYHRIIKQMGADGWMGVGWPTEYGGKGLGGIEQQIFANEAARADIHLPSVTLQTVGPTLQKFGTDKQKAMFLRDILAGEVHFAIGYSEPEAGTDLASLATTARREGDHYIVNGQKLWTTGAHTADYIWLAVRTAPDAPKHKGISVLIVDTADPGYSWTPIITCDGSHHVNATFYDDVRVPADMLVGEENRGWELITAQLNHERVMLGPAGRLEGLRDLVRDWALTREAPDGTPLLEIAAVRDALARTTAAYRVNELLNWQVAGRPGTGRQVVADASASKVFASEAVQRLGLELAEVVAAYADPSEPQTDRLLRYLDATAKRNLVLTFGGGVNEVQRELIAVFGLGLPKARR